MTIRRELRTDYRCPQCGTPLVGDRDLLSCTEHGFFFAYGPQLLVRLPRENGQATALLPWEREELQAAR
jgi:uncharacterized Zn finger protein (UPF0148 family)